MNVKYYVWRITYPVTGEVLMSSRPYTSYNRAVASLRLMAKHYSEIREEPYYYLDLLCVCDTAPNSYALDEISKPLRNIKLKG